MPKPVTRRFKAAVTAVKLKGTPVMEDDEVVIEDPCIVVTMRLEGTKANMRLFDFLGGCKVQKTIDVQLESAQLELI